MQREFDFLVVGSGIAGLTFALDVCERGSVCLVTKKEKEESNTWYAQGESPGCGAKRIPRPPMWPIPSRPAPGCATKPWSS